MPDPKTALVTGASRGIGFEISRQLVDRGWRVGMIARNPKTLEKAANKLDPRAVLALPCDVTDQLAVDAAVKQLSEHFSAPDALINNAGIIDPIGLMHDTDPAGWMRLIEVNISGVMLATRAILPAMLARRDGVIINLSSGAAHNAVPGWSAYCTSKAGLAMYTKMLAAEYGDRGIRVHDFIPGVVGTDMLNGAQTKFDNAVARLEDDAKLTPDIPARCIAWLVDEGEGRVDGVEQSIRDASLRAKVGLEERAQW